ncbi:hypothetical protein VHUM_01533 [Vanrija humicola]|uniref:50S ribosomal protein L35 n=1 Tax=Vanrija humicola TaxID=5417 RepID=A0A7D8Z5B3_VANHU|nr:hypothetical protein VHUM_01533 [Vanrija humicola]
MKSHQGAKKRFKKTASGMTPQGQCGKQHLNTGFSATRINRLQKAAYTTKTQVGALRVRPLTCVQSKTISRLLPYA